MKAKLFLLLVAVFNLMAVIAQNSIHFSSTIKAMDEPEQASVLTSLRSSVVFKHEANTRVDSPSTMQIIYFNDSKGSSTTEHDEAYYLKLAKKERTRGIVFTTLGYPMIGAGTYLFAAGMQKLIIGDGIDADKPTAIGPLITAIISGAGLLATGIPFAIMGPIALSDVKYYKKKAEMKRTSYNVEPTILNMHGSKTACGLSFRLHF